MTPSAPLTDTQLVLLSAASQRADQLVTVPTHLKGGAARKVVTKLLGLGLLPEAADRPGEPGWRTDGDQALGLKITAAGLAVLGIEPDGTRPDGPSPAAAPEPRDAAPRPTGAFRDGTKQARVVALLARPEGADLDDLIAATGWLPHTVRAALTGLRRKGYALARSKGEEGRTVYCIGEGAGTAADGTASLTGQEG